MRRGEYVVLQEYKKYSELIFRYVMWKNPQLDDAAALQLLSLIWKKAAENEKALAGKSERERRDLLFRIANSVMASHTGANKAFLEP